MSTSAPTRAEPKVDPRIQERIRSVSRGRTRRRFWWTLAAALVVALGAGAFFLAHSSLLSARVVTVRGVGPSKRAQVLSAAGLSGHPPLIDVDPGASEAALERVPWVGRAAVVRHWPDGVAVRVTVRHPAAEMAAAGGWAVVDGTGRVLSTSPTAVPGLPTLQVGASAGAPGTWLASLADPGVAVAATLPAAFRAQVVSVTVRPGGQVELHLTTPVTVDLGSTSQLHQKYQDVAALIAGATLGSGDLINVTVPDSPVVAGP